MHTKAQATKIRNWRILRLRGMLASNRSLGGEEHKTVERALQRMLKAEILSATSSYITVSIYERDLSLRPEEYKVLFPDGDYKATFENLIVFLELLRTFRPELIPSNNRIKLLLIRDALR